MRNRGRFGFAWLILLALLLLLLAATRVAAAPPAPPDGAADGAATEPDPAADGDPTNADDARGDTTGATRDTDDATGDATGDATDATDDTDDTDDATADRPTGTRADDDAYDAMRLFEPAAGLDDPSLIETGLLAADDEPLDSGAIERGARFASAAFVDDAALADLGSWHRRPSRWGRVDLAVAWRRGWDITPERATIRNTFWLVATWRR